MAESESAIMFEVIWKGVKVFITIVGAVFTFMQGGIEFGGKDKNEVEE